SATLRQEPSWPDTYPPSCAAAASHRGLPADCSCKCPSKPDRRNHSCHPAPAHPATADLQTESESHPAGIPPPRDSARTASSRTSPFRPQDCSSSNPAAAYKTCDSKTTSSVAYTPTQTRQTHSPSCSEAGACHSAP